jgi:non-ribosomal peptide synthetase component F
MMRGVHALRSAAGVSPFTVLQAATAIGIARVTGQADLLLGTDTANRRPQTRDLIGFMVDAQLTPVTIGNGASLREVVDQIRDHAAAAVPHSRSYCGEIERALGGPEVVKVNANPASSRINGSLDLPGLSAVEVPVPSERRHWRNLGVFWSVGTHSSAGSVMFRPARVDHRTAAAVADTIEASLATADG